ncbi:hypothetical protein GCM10011368_08370 [Hyunsoonleella pacifica]|nr:hypothetical protein GCM10011368_08370 [Hyunsoonleella pacifica]
MDVYYLFYFRITPRNSRFPNRRFLFLNVERRCRFKITYMPKSLIYVYAIQLFWVELGITNFPPPPS